MGIVACGSSNKDNSVSSTPAPAAAKTTTSASSGAGTTLAIAADPGGNLSYDKTSLTANAGAVTIDFTNKSSVPHNVTIEQGQTEAGATDTIQGSKTSKAFTLSAGKYTFYCSVGSHESAGMKGELTVK